MKWLVVALFAVFPLSISAQCFGPGGCAPETPFAPGELCFPSVCVPVTYTSFGPFILAQSELPNGYAVLGWSGPCLAATCPEQATQAYWDVWLNARRALRAQRAIQP